MTKSRTAAVSSQPSLAGRAFLAALLFVGFYVLALGLAALLLAVPWAMYRTTERVQAQLSLACIVGALVILYSVFPRIDRFVPPGPQLKPGPNLKLFALIRRIAKATGQHMPAEVYLVPGLQAFVTHRGGILGLGSKRVMGLGLPTFEALTVAQLAAVIAHEFGHYNHGDTAIGPWLYKTRAAMGRTLHNLTQHESILAIPFAWYGKMFVRVTTAVSRRQEYGADALAARIAGARALAGGLERVHAAGPVFDSYWQSEVVPVLMSGRLPPIAAGFSRFMAGPKVAEGYEQVLQFARDVEEDQFDTHPPLTARLQAIEGMGDRPTEIFAENARAIELLGNVTELENALIEHLAAAANEQANLKPIQWDEVGREIWIPIWQARVNEARQNLKGVTPLDLSGVAGEPSHLAVRLKLAASANLATDEQRGQALSVFGAALCLALAARQWTLHALPGEDVMLTNGALEIRPYHAFFDLAQERVSAAQWEALCQEAGIAQIDLGTLQIAVPA